MTMLQLALFFTSGLVALSLCHLAGTLWMTGVLRRPRATLLPDSKLPSAAVLLCLRGAESGLADGLRRLLSQDYPDYDVFIVVDSEADPAWPIVQRVIDECNTTNVHVSPLRRRLTTCSLKCSSLVQMLDDVGDRFEVIALVDADVKPHATWLRELVAPLEDPQVGATFGNRWYVPEQGWMGSLVRQLSNAPGLVVMYLTQIPWAGSMAIRASVVKAGNLRDRWAHAIVDDGPARIAVKEQQLRLQFVPSLVMANREDCTLAVASNFLRRQFMWTSTYVRAWWPAMLLHTICSAILWVRALTLAGCCLLDGNLTTATVFACSSVFFGTTLALCWFLLDLAARRVIREQGEPAWDTRWSRLIPVPIAMFVSGCVTVPAMLFATTGRRVNWRGVTYQVTGPWQIRVIDDEMRRPDPSSIRLAAATGRGPQRQHDTKHRVLLIGGLPGSGKSVLRAVCNTHPAVALTDELRNFVQPDTRALRHLQCLVRRRLLVFSPTDNFNEWPNQREKYIFLAKYVSLICSRFGRLGVDGIAEVLRQISPDATVVGDSFSSYRHCLQQYRHTAGLYPVVVVRDCRDVACRVLKRVHTRWKGHAWTKNFNTAEKVADRWVAELTSIEEAGQHVTVVKYEELLDEPRQTMQQLATLLELDVELFDYSRVHREKRGEYEAYLTEAEVDDVLRIAGPAMERWGYLPATGNRRAA